MSAIYGYNLSARPDYDRDIPRKRAMAVLYRFSMQHNYARSLLAKIYNDNDDFDVPVDVQPGDLLYADDDDDVGVTMMYDGVYDDKKYILGGDDADWALMELGRRLYPSDEMVTKAICVDKGLFCIDGDGEDGGVLEAVCKSAFNTDDPYKKVALCESEVVDGYAINSCCNSRGAKKYVISYKVVDARWVDRQTGQLNYDFWRALAERPYADNIGIITKQNNGKWLFRGKMNFLPSYEKQKYTWGVTHPDEDFPLKEKVRTEWELPEAIFNANFFVDKENNNMCNQGCVFKIKSF